MKALVVHKFGSLDDVGWEEVDVPGVRPGSVCVSTRASSLNHLDLHVVRGLPGKNPRMPHILGSDGAGVVEACGEDAQRFRPGDRVMLNPVMCCGECEFCARGEQSLCIRLGLMGENATGTHAEKFVVPEGNLSKIPQGVSFEAAAAFSLVFQTAWRMLKTKARIGRQEDVFIHGIGGGVSTAALKVVKYFEGRAFVSSSSDDKLQKAKELGADFCYNYTQEDVVKAVRAETGKRGVDIVVDSVGDATWRQSLEMVRKGGRIVTCGATSGPNPKTEIRLIFWKQLEILGSTMSNEDEYDEAVALLGKGDLLPVIDRTFSLSEGKDALEYLKAGRQLGKVVLVPS